jgi:hypothetical protein
MMPGSKAQPGVQDDDALAAPRASPAPAGFDEKMPSDFDRLEVMFPRFGPIAPREWFNRDPGFAGIKTKSPQLFQPVLQPGAKRTTRRWQPVRVSRHESGAGFLVAKD